MYSRTAQLVKVLAQANQSYEDKPKLLHHIDKVKSIVQGQQLDRSALSMELAHLEKKMHNLLSFERKFYYLFNQIEGFWAWSTNALIIFALGWLPTALGGGEFNATLLSYNLPIITRYLMTIAMFGLLFSAIISTKLLPPRPADQPKTKYIWMVLQWLLVPFTLILLGAIPAIESQTRLMLNKPLTFWVTPKIRK